LELSDFEDLVWSLAVLSVTSVCSDSERVLSDFEDTVLFESVLRLDGVLSDLVDAVDPLEDALDVELLEVDRFCFVEDSDELCDEGVSEILDVEFCARLVDVDLVEAVEKSLRDDVELMDWLVLSVLRVLLDDRDTVLLELFEAVERLEGLLELVDFSDSLDELSVPQVDSERVDPDDVEISDTDVEAVLLLERVETLDDAVLLELVDCELRELLQLEDELDTKLWELSLLDDVGGWNTKRPWAGTILSA
jgi:hypothetical protein